MVMEYTGVLLCVFCSFVWNIGASTADVCEVEQKGGVDWILQVREHDHGWKENTHRANIALAVAMWEGDEVEMRKMELQLETELTKMLLRNKTSMIHENDLALFIHAFLARNKNPRNFYGIDLVEDLLNRVNYRIRNVHPFIVLALCNSNVVNSNHLLRIKDYLMHKDVESRYHMEMKALALKAFACAASDSHFQNQAEVNIAIQSLISKQNKTDGTFGNVYTTALVSQALIASGTKEKWEKKKALKYLKQESKVQVNMIKTYLILMAENAEKVKFIKDLYKGKLEPVEPRAEKIKTSDSHFVGIYVIPNDKLRYSIMLRVPKAWNVYQIMQECSNLSDKFKFTFYPNKDDHVFINSISGIPDNAEENQFWITCVERHYSQEKYIEPLSLLVPTANSLITFYYGLSDCPRKISSEYINQLNSM